MITYILAAVTAAALLAADQYTKFFISTHYTLAESHGFIPGILNITFTKNTGAAWGMLSDRTWLLISITAVVMLICIALILKYGTKNKLLFWAMMLVLSGGVGNMIDRVFRKDGVIDFLQLDFWKSFPIFNVADCAITVGAGLIVLYFIIDICRDQREKSRKRNAANNADEQG